MDFDEIDEKYEEVIAFLDGINCGIALRNREGLIVGANRRLLDWLGYELEELEGRSVISMMPEEIRMLNLESMREIEKGDKRARLTILQRKDTTTLPVLAIPLRLEDDNGDFAGVLGIIIEMGTVETARNLKGPDHLQTCLDRISADLRTICTAAGMRFPRLDPDHPTLRDISAREMEVLRYLMDGDRVSKIASRLHISPHTVRNHLKSMFRKLGVESQSELIDHVRSLSEPESN